MLKLRKEEENEKERGYRCNKFNYNSNLPYSFTEIVLPHKQSCRYNQSNQCHLYYSSCGDRVTGGTNNIISKINHFPQDSIEEILCSLVNMDYNSNLTNTKIKLVIWPKTCLTLLEN